MIHFIDGKKSKFFIISSLILASVIAVLASFVFAGSYDKYAGYPGAARTQSVLFDFDTAPLHSPFPINLTAGGITAHFSAPSGPYNYSIQQANVLGFTPAGFAGYCVYPNQVFACDLLISFDQPLTDISIMYAPEEYATDTSCTMRITAYVGATFVGTHTYTNPNAGTWPTGILSLSSAQPFDNVVIHYNNPPVTGGDYGPIFMADNLTVTTAGATPTDTPTDTPADTPTASPLPTCVPPPSGMVGWWPGNGNANDIQGPTFENGALQGNATYSGGKVLQAFSFDGSQSSFVEIPDSPSLNPTSAFTADGWFYIDPFAPRGSNDIGTLVSKSNGELNSYWSIYFDDRDNTKRLRFVMGGNVSYTNAIPVADWYYIAGTFDSASTPRAKLYLNGSLVADSGSAVFDVSPNNLSFRIGAMHWTETFGVGNDRLNGKADEVEFLDRALSATEIQAIYDAGSAGKCKSATTPTPTATPTSTSTPPPIITGTVIYANAAAPPKSVSNVLISGLGSPPVSTLSGFPSGTYSLSGFGAGSYTVTPTKSGGVNGISSFDAARIAQHVAGIPPMLNATQLMAADVSGNGIISSFDAGQVAQYVVSGTGMQTGAWKFSPANRTYTSVTADITGEDYLAILMGEVSGNWTNTGARPASSNGPERKAVITMPSLVLADGHEVIIPVAATGIANMGIISYEFVLRYDPKVIQPMPDPVELRGSVSSGLSFAVNAKEAGLLKVAVYGTKPLKRNGVLLYLRFTAVGAPNSVSPITWERIMLNESTLPVTAGGGQIKISTAAEQIRSRGFLIFPFMSERSSLTEAAFPN